MLNRNLVIGASFVIALGVLAIGYHLSPKGGSASRAPGGVSDEEVAEAPRYEVDPMWPKPLPNHWVLGSTIGAAVDADNHIWIIHRSSATLSVHENQLEKGIGECCRGAPPVLEFDQEGNLLRHWGGPGEGYEWPDSNHGIFVDYKGNVWIGGNGGPDSQILKFTKDGKFLLQIGKKGARRKAAGRGGAGEGAVVGYEGNSNDTANFGRVAKIFVDQKANEAYIADGYLNKRVAVLDADTGAMKRWWGAYGNKPDDTPLPAYDPAQPLPQQFRTPVHCADMSVDRLIYVCDRVNNRLQVFTAEGKFVKEQVYAPKTGENGAVWDVAFSSDPEQRFLFIVDGVNDKIRVIERQTLKEVTAFGDGGRQPGQFHAVHSIAIDHNGNLYTTETYEGKRVQRFLLKGMGKVAKDQGVLWPSK
jgi:DNA-binding beta-propeller fold protein YncE